MTMLTTRQLVQIHVLWEAVSTLQSYIVNLIDNRLGLGGPYPRDSPIFTQDAERTLSFSRHGMIKAYFCTDSGFGVVSVCLASTSGRLRLLV